MATKPLYTLDQVIGQLNSGYKWSGQDLTYSFPTTATWFPYAEAAGFSAFTEAQKAAARTVMSLWDDLIAPDFREVAGSNANIKYENTTTNVGYAHAYYPGTYTGAGSVWMNSNYGAGSGTNNLMTPVVGDWGFQTFIHETGHALGLDHAGEYNGGSPTYALNATYFQDSQQYTVMSYFTANNTGADWYASDGRWYYPQTPMLYDVLAMQAMYGAETTTRTGNTTYGFNATADVPSIFNFSINKHPVLCIYDSGGIDTLDLSGWNTASRIDLAPGSFSDSDMMTSNISIAFSATIENARGGGGADTISGNAVANLLAGLAGNDTLSGLAGNDTLDGGEGNDTLNGGVGNDRLLGGLGSDTAVYTGLRANYSIVYDAIVAAFTIVDLRVGSADGADWLQGLEFARFTDFLIDLSTLTTTTTTTPTTKVPGPTEAADTLNGTTAGDSIAGLGGSDRINGLAGNDLLDGGTGNDTLVGGLGDDSYWIDSTLDQIVENAGEGIDTVRSTVTHTLATNVEHLILLGASGINGSGNALANSLTGNGANNVLDGGAGADTMAGGAGNDTYMVENAGDVVSEAAGAGIDTVQASVSHVLAANVENLVLTGAAAINGTGNALSNSLTGNAAANVLDGGLAADVMAGGGGNDTYVVDDKGDVVTEFAGAGVDTVRASVSATLSANVENLVLTGAAAIDGNGNDLANVITGNAAANVINGGLGADTMIGGFGNDSYFIDSATDSVIEYAGEGTDTVYAGIAVTLGANVENLVITGASSVGGTGNSLGNRMTGNGGANSLDGGAGNDVLYGMGGNDVIRGGTGADQLYGGTGQRHVRLRHHVRQHGAGPRHAPGLRPGRGPRRSLRHRCAQCHADQRRLHVHRRRRIHGCGRAAPRRRWLRPGRRERRPRRRLRTARVRRDPAQRRRFRALTRMPMGQGMRKDPGRVTVRGLLLWWSERRRGAAASVLEP
jgi:serralysin